jgi:L-alanine-DL-glutamate epimerase-like enolase superfamily enzyme
MLRQLKVHHQSWPLSAPFRISRGVKTVADVVLVEITEAEVRGRGEGIPYPRYGESVESVMAQVQSISAAVEQGMPHEALQYALPAGAARNAIDCAMWDLSAGLTGVSVVERLAKGPLPSLVTALTVGLDTPEAMRAAAIRLQDAPLIKVKVDAASPEAQLSAVRAGAPQARLIVDPNESWTLEILQSLQPLLVELGIELVEQPLPAGQDAALQDFRPAVPICADESCHVAGDLSQLSGRYQAVNIKLDKTGGLSGALQLLQAATSMGLQIMCGCMISTSLSIAPALHIARHAAFVDLDGPLWLQQDRVGGVRLDNGRLLPPAAELWGNGVLAEAL